RRGVGQRPVGGHRRLRREQGVVGVADDEVQRLPNLIRAGADGGGPRGDGLRARVFEHGLIRTLGEARHVVHRRDGDDERLGGAPASSSTVWSAPLVKLGASFTAVTVMVNVWAALVSTPLLAVPPSSWTCTVSVPEPLALAAVV